MGSNTGVTELLIIIGVRDTMDQLQFHVATPIIPNQAVPWETNGASTNVYTALSLYLQSQNGSNVDRVLFPTSGTITVTESSQVINGATRGTIGPTSFAETDDTGAVLAGGCVSDITGLTFSLAQGAAAFQKPESGDVVVDGGRQWMKIIPNGKFGELYPR